MSLRYFLSNFESMGISIQKKKFNIDFQDGNCGGHLVYLIGTILATFDLQATSMIITKFQVNWPFSSGEEAKNRFSRWPSWISYWNDLATFDLQVTLMFPTNFESTGLLVQEKTGKIDFQDGSHGGHLGFPIGMILAIFDLQVTPMLPTKFQVNCSGV